MESFDLKATSNAIKERAILIGVQLPNNQTSYMQPLTELENLATTANVEVVGRLTQKRNKFHPGKYMGKGKIIELKELAQELEASLIICDDDLSPGQARTLEDETGVRIMDRTEMILDIFAVHAQTKEAKLQVELAQMQYILPRLRRMWTHLEGEQGGVGFRGPGEKQLETDRQIIKKRIADCKREISKIKERKEREVKQRNKRFFTVGLVGYTNAGKSSLMNALTEADVYVEDKLFATLDTKTRLWEVNKGCKVLLSDTVGFINKLPHRLVASFKATLEEASQANILLHVVDCSHVDAEYHIEAVNKVLKELHIGNQSTLMVFNKMDLVTDQVDLEILKRKYPDYICISAKEKLNFDVLTDKILEMVEENMMEIHATIPSKNGKLISWMSEYGNVLDRQFKEGKAYFHVSLTKPDVKWLKQQPHVEVTIV